MLFDRYGELVPIRLADSESQLGANPAQLTLKKLMTNSSSIIIFQLFPSLTVLGLILPLIGLAILVATLVPLRRLMAIIPVGALRSKWRVINGLVFLFIAAYLGYIVTIWNQPAEWIKPPIPGILLFGAIFVWLAIRLSLQTAVSLQRMDSLETENITDALTKVYNRRYLNRRLEEEVSRAKRHALELSILLIDIDHFKRINDTYGHQAGDVALSLFGRLLKVAFRDVDIVARYGGEEFLVICTNTGVDEAALVAERLREMVESHPFEISDGAGGSLSIQFSISIGVAGLSGRLDSSEKLVQAADIALYRAKREGRNRVVIDGAAIREPVISV